MPFKSGDVCRPVDRREASTFHRKQRDENLTMQDNHIDGEATNLWTERRAVEAKGGPDEEGGRGVMHEGTPSPVVMLAFSGCIL